MPRATDCDSCQAPEAPWWITHSGTGDTSTLCNNCLLDLATTVAEAMVAAAAEQVGEVPVEPSEVAAEHINADKEPPLDGDRFPTDETEPEEGATEQENTEGNDATNGQGDTDL